MNVKRLRTNNLFFRNSFRLSKYFFKKKDKKTSFALDFKINRHYPAIITKLFLKFKRLKLDFNLAWERIFLKEVPIYCDGTMGEKDRGEVWSLSPDLITQRLPRRTQHDVFSICDFKQAC